MSDDLVKRYRELQGLIGGCHDGYCVIKKPQGMHTNGGCKCLEDMKLHEQSRVGGLLKYGQEMADRIEELEARLAEYKMVASAIDNQWAANEDEIAKLKAKTIAFIEFLDANYIHAFGDTARAKIRALYAELTAPIIRQATDPKP